jgi:hypothetical protein
MEDAESEVTALAAATDSKDPAVGLAAVASLRGLVEVLEALQVDNARANGWSWREIAGPARGQQAGRAPEARAAGPARCVRGRGGRGGGPARR